MLSPMFGVGTKQITKPVNIPIEVVSPLCGLCLMYSSAVSFVDGDHYGHYQNLTQIQQQLRCQDQYKQMMPPPGQNIYGRYPEALARSEPHIDSHIYQRGYGPPPPRYDNRDWAGSGHYPQSQPGGYYPHTPHHAMPPPTQAALSSRRTASPSRVTNQTPISQLNYVTAGHTSRTPGGPGPPPQHRIVNPQPQHDIYSHHPLPTPRTYTEFDDPRRTYNDYGYSSLPRRRETRTQNGFTPGSAQVWVMLGTGYSTNSIESCHPGNHSPRTMFTAPLVATIPGSSRSV